MKVYSLVGKSGTGKSYQAIDLCRKKGIESIIDDGLFIVGNSITAGISAKRQATRIKAIKTALFTESAHRNSVAEKIGEIAPGSILVIGTSERMIARITARLGLPAPEETIYIEEITSEEERIVAGRQRDDMGQHIIPAPTFQLKKDFSGYFMHPLRMFKDLRGGRTPLPDRSVVRPTFSYLGNYTISDRALSDIVKVAGVDADGVVKIIKVFADKKNDGLVLDLTVILRYGVQIIDVAKALQEQVRGQVEMMTAFNISAVNVKIKGLA
ncbi:MAG: Asp23/Gls24 family envelope stress response protein, partial [Clostridiales Family XIII bacterium]|nr:Asp23/Gls24 family envelope stress response protein [Clostridiales Family XIII bacterium]